MGASIASLKLLCIELYNASDPSLGLGIISPNTEWVKSLEFEQYLILSDASIANLICQKKGFAARRPFITGTQAGIANGALLGNAVGPVETITFTVTGGPWAGTHPGAMPRGVDLDQKLSEIMIENRNVTLNSEIEPHWIQDGQHIWHNAAGLVLGGASAVSLSATFAVVTLNLAATTALCGDEWSEAIVYGALSTKFTMDGQKVEAAMSFHARQQSKLAALGIQ